MFILVPNPHRGSLVPRLSPRPHGKGHRGKPLMQRTKIFLFCLARGSHFVEAFETRISENGINCLFNSQW